MGIQNYLLIISVVFSLHTYSQSVGIGSVQFVPLQMLEVRGDITINNATADAAFRIANSKVLHVKGTSNLFVGVDAGLNSTGSWNTFIGPFAGYGSVGMSGSGNICIGFVAGEFLTTGSDNIFCGYASGDRMTSGINNCFYGYRTGQKLTTGSNNCVYGYAAMFAGANGTASRNVLSGAFAAQQLITGNDNVYVGYSSGVGNTGANNNNVLVGSNSGATLTTGSNNTFIGFTADGAANISNATAVGNYAYAGASNSMVLGSISGINGATASVNVGIGTTTPSAKLDVNGSSGSTIKIVDTNQGNGKVLLSDASGNASWGNVTSAAGYGAGGSSCCNDWTLVAVANSTNAGSGEVSSGFTVVSGKQYLVYFIHGSGVDFTLATTDAIFLIEYFEIVANGNYIVTPKYKLSQPTGGTTCDMPILFCGRVLNGNAASSTSLGTISFTSNVCMFTPNTPEVRLKGDGVIYLYDDVANKDYGLYIFER